MPQYDNGKDAPSGWRQEIASNDRPLPHCSVHDWECATIRVTAVYVSGQLAREMLRKDPFPICSQESGIERFHSSV